MICKYMVISVSFGVFSILSKKYKNISDSLGLCLPAPLVRSHMLHQQGV